MLHSEGSWGLGALWGNGSKLQGHYLLVAPGRSGSCVGALIPSPTEFSSHHEDEKRRDFSGQMSASCQTG